jgi:pimeloyl-ACP methyl ester carboxylesterase
VGRADLSAAGVDDRGDGFPIVFSHGMLMDRTMFEPQLAGLSGRYRTIAFDHRSRGDEGAQPFDLYDLAGDLIALLDERHIEQCILVGMSLGGFMAIRAAIRHPDRIRGIVVVGAGALPYEPEARERSERHFGAHRHEDPIERAFAAAEAEKHFSPITRRRRPELAAHWTERFATRTGTQTWHETLAWSRQDDVRGVVADLRAPVLLVHGDEDEAIPLEAALATHRLIPGSRLHVVAFAGHGVNLEKPDVVNDAIGDFADELLHR